MAPNDYDEESSGGEESVEAKPQRKRKQKKWKDPNKPKRAMSAFFLYSQQMRDKVKQDNPDASFGQVARLLAEKYKKLSSKEMNKYTKQAEKDKMRYQEEMKTYVPAPDPTGGGKKKRKKDPNAPKRNMSAYFLYSIDARPKVKEANPDAAFGDIARLISEQFKGLSDKQRAVWDKKAVADKERYVAEMAKYKA